MSKLLYLQVFQININRKNGLKKSQLAGNSVTHRMRKNQKKPECSRNEDNGQVLIAKSKVNKKSSKKENFLKVPILGQRNHSWWLQEALEGGTQHCPISCIRLKKTTHQNQGKFRKKNRQSNFRNSEYRKINKPGFSLIFYWVVVF